MINLNMRLTWKRFAVIGGAVTFLFGGYHLFSPGGDSLNDLRLALADKAVKQVVEDLPIRKRIRTLAVMPLKNDLHGYIARQLRREVRDVGKYDVVGEALLARLKAKLGIRPEPVWELKAALRVLRKLGPDAGLFGEIRQFRSDSEAAILRMDVRMVERDSGNVVFLREYDLQLDGGAYQFRTRMQSRPAGMRILVWLVFAALLPFISLPVSLPILRRESNAANLVLVISCILLDMVLAFVLVAFDFSGFWKIILLIAAFISCSVYTYRILDYLDDTFR